LIDELDRAGEEIEAFLLEVLDENQLTIPELGTIKSDDPPIIIITSNRTRKISDALKRRCLYLYLDPPEMDRELKIVRMKVPSLDEHITTQIVEFMQTIRYQENLTRIPGISETLDWAMALAELEVEIITPDVIKRSISTIVKEPEDLELLKDDVIERILADINKGLET
jgi:MoxR-like ATPase